MSVVVTDEAELRRIVTGVVAAQVKAILDRMEGIQAPDAALPPLLTARQVAEWLQVDERTLRRLVHEGAVPPPIHIAARIPRWRRKDLESFADRAHKALLRRG